MNKPSDQLTNCKSCTANIDAGSSYCPACGGSIATKRLTVGRLVNKAVVSIFNFDLPFFNTLKWLITDPSQVTNGYINGVRKIIVSPIQFTITVLAIYGFYQFMLVDFLDLTSRSSILGGIEDGFLIGFDKTSNSAESEKIMAFVNNLHKHNQAISTLMIPILAILGRYIFYRKSGFNMAEHLSVAFYTVSLTILSSMFIGALCSIYPNDLTIGIFIFASSILSFGVILWIYHKTITDHFYKPILLFICSNILFLIVFFILILTGSNYIEQLGIN